MLKALANGPRKKSSHTSKIFTAGFISLVSELLGHRLTSTDIRELFNAAAVDMGRYEQIDEDLPTSHEAFSKSIQRVREFIDFPSLLNPDKK